MPRRSVRGSISPVALPWRWRPAHAEGSEDLRRQLVAEIGEDALVDLALTIAGVRVYPTIKRALGYATSCKLVEIHT